MLLLEKVIYDCESLVAIILYLILNPLRMNRSTDKLTASPSTLSLEPRWLPTTDSSTATQRCLSGKLGAMKYRDWPGQQEVWGCDSSFST